MTRGFLIFTCMGAAYKGGFKRSSERRVVLPGDVVSWKRADRTGARGQVCENTFTGSGRVRVIELDDAGEVLHQTTVHPVKILRHVSERMDLVLLRPCPGCGGEPKQCACPTWAPLEAKKHARQWGKRHGILREVPA